jgi:hypothetical protein
MGQEYQMWIRPLARSSTLAMLVALAGAGTLAKSPQPAQTPTEFYLAYRAAFDKATKVDDLFPYLAAANRKQVEATPKADRDKKFGLMKIVGTLTNVRVLKEERTAQGVTLTVEGIDADRKKQTGTVKIVKEISGWKVGDESWSS